jgi:hypothetical protein
MKLEIPTNAFPYSLDHLEFSSTLSTNLATQITNFLAAINIVEEKLVTTP